MKKIKLCTAVFAAGLLFSCSSDDNGGGASTSGSILGKWYNKESISLGQTVPYDDHEDCGKDFLEFSEDNTGRFVDVWNCEEYSENFTYVRSGNTLTVSVAGQSDSAQIVEVTSTILKLKVSYDFDDDGTDDDVIEVYTRN